MAELTRFLITPHYYGGYTAPYRVIDAPTEERAIEMAKEGHSLSKFEGWYFVATRCRYQPKHFSYRKNNRRKNDENDN